jgi:hypothetical protein
MNATLKDQSQKAVSQQKVAKICNLDLLKKTFKELVRGAHQHMTSHIKNSVTVTNKRRDCDWDMLRKLEQISESKTHTQF